jgi:hypothetical protein
MIDLTRGRLDMRNIIVAVSAFSLLAGTASSVAASPCRDTKGKFMKCPAKAAPKRCKDAKGKFAKCGTAGAKPVK